MAVEELGLEFVVSGWQEFFRLTNQADEQIGNVGSSAMHTSSILDNALSVALGVGLVKAAEAAMDAIIQLGTDFVGFIDEGVDMAIDFEDQMINLSIAASATGRSYDELSTAALAVGGDTRLFGVSASGAAEAMTNLFKAGLTEQQVLGDLNAYLNEGAELGGALRASIDLAAASTLDMGQAADLASVVLTAFGDQAADSGRSVDEFLIYAMDKLVRSADASRGEVEDFAAALPYIGPTVRDLGIDIDDFATSMGLLSNAGIDATTAGTSLNQMIQSLTAPTDKANDAMTELGVDVWDTSGNFIGIAGTVREFEIALAGMNDEQRSAALGAIMTTNGQRALNALLAEGTSGIADFNVQMDDSAGLQEQMAARAQSTSAQWEALQGQIETLQIAMGTLLLPVIKELIAAAGELLEEYGPKLQEAFASAVPYIENLIEWLIKLATGDIKLGEIIPTELLQTIEMFADAIENLFEWLIKLATGDAKLSDLIPPEFLQAAEILEKVIIALIPVFGALAAILTSAGIANAISTIQAGIAAIIPSFPALAAYLSAVAGPVTAFIGLVALLGAMIARHWDDIKPILDAVWQAMQKVFVSLSESMRGPMAALGESLAGLWEAFLKLLDALEPVLMILGGLLVIALGVAIGFITGLAEGLTYLIAGLAQALDGLITFGSGILNAVTGLLMAIWGLITGDLDLWREGFYQFWGGVRDIFSGAMEAISGIITAGFTGIIAFVHGFIKGVIAFFTTLYEELVGGSIVPDMMQAIFDSISSWIDTILDSFSSFVEGVIGTISSLASWMAGAWTGMRDSAAAAWDSIVSTISAKVQDIYNAIVGTLSGIDVGAIIGGIGGGLGIGSGGSSPGLSNIAGAAAGARVSPPASGRTATSSSRTNIYNTNANSNVTNNFVVTPNLALETMGAVRQ